MTGTPPDDEGQRALYELRLKPIRLWPSPLAGRWKPPSLNAAAFDTTAAWVLPVYLRKATPYFVWQKEPWDAGDDGGDKNSNSHRSRCIFYDERIEGREAPYFSFSLIFDRKPPACDAVSAAANSSAVL